MWCIRKRRGRVTQYWQGFSLTGSPCWSVRAVTALWSAGSEIAKYRAEDAKNTVPTNEGWEVDVLPIGDFI